jgi:hypothetical protein
MDFRPKAGCETSPLLENLPRSGMGGQAGCRCHMLRLKDPLVAPPFPKNHRLAAGDGGSLVDFRPKAGCETSSLLEKLPRSGMGSQTGGRCHMLRLKDPLEAPAYLDFSGLDAGANNCEDLQRPGADHDIVGLSLFWAPGGGGGEDKCPLGHGELE